MNGPAWPDAQPWDTLVFALVAAVIVVVNRKAMLTREGAVTEVLMPGEEGSPDRHERTEKIEVSPHPEGVGR